jgi:D-lyxose ketol-isomerase
MLSLAKVQAARQATLEMLRKVNIALTPEEAERIEVADFGLDNLDCVGLQLLTYVNTNRVCAKELVLLPGQTCPEHLHPPVFGDPGKEETFRCRWGEVYLYVPGEPLAALRAKVPTGQDAYFTVRHEIVLHPGEQYTIPPETLHWFQAGPEGAIVSEFSTTSRDEYDIFTDPHIIRKPQVSGQ